MNTISRYRLHLFQLSEEHQVCSWLFIKLLAVIYFIAFLSLAVQITGLAGPNGILPLDELLQHAYQQYGYVAFIYLPTLFWVNASDTALQFIAYAGCLLSIALFAGYSPRNILILLFIFYLSLFHAGQIFLQFQWDSLLLEAGFLAIFLTAGPTHLIVFLYHWLLFRLRFMSGVSKLLSGDPTWANLTTLNYYFETEPLPHTGSWYFHQLPEIILQAGTLFVFFTELIVPFFIFLPRKFRIAAVIITIIMQLLVIATSNHNWINLLTIILCLFVLDDRIIKKVIPNFLLPDNIKKPQQPQKINLALPVIALLIVSVSSFSFINNNSPYRAPESFLRVSDLVKSWGIGHTYHVFPTMQTERQELQIEGSYDGIEWKAYQFKYKPGPLDKRPAFIVPHQPRLDWMIWFVPPQVPSFAQWFNQFISKLEQGSPEVLDLLAYNPFKNKPPKYIRVLAFQYKYTTMEEREKTGNWWKYKYLGEFPNVKPRRP